MAASNPGKGEGEEDEIKDLPPYTSVSKIQQESFSKKSDAASSSKKSPYASTLQKLKRKVRRGHTSSVEPVMQEEPKQSNVICNKIFEHFITSDQPSSSKDSPSTSSLVSASQPPSVVASALVAIEKDESENVRENVPCQHREDSLSYFYETTNPKESDQDSGLSRSEASTPNYQNDPPHTSDKETASDESFVYIDANELFERPDNSAMISLRAPCLYITHNDEGQTTTPALSGQATKPGIAPGTNYMKDNLGKPALESTASFRYSDPYFPSLMQDSIRELALDGQFADVTIEVEGQRIRCHRIILAASSKYFKAMFCNAYRERDQSTVTLQGVSADVMKVLIRYAYTSYLEVNRETVQSVLEAASLLQFTRIMEACSNYFVGQLAIENAPGFMELAHRHNLDHLLVLARLKCVTCFNDFREKSDYLNLSASLLESLVSRSDLMVRKEEELFEIVITWCQHCPETRKHNLPQLLKHVKLPLIDPIFFVRRVETHSLIRNNPDVFDLMMEARQYRTSGDIKEGPRIVPRQNALMHQVFVTVGGCNKDDRFISEISVLDFQHKTRATLCQMPSSQNSTRGLVNAGSDNQVSKTKWAEFACTAWKDNIVISGGKESKKEAWMFITSLRQWVQLASLNTARWRHRMTVCCGELYVVGGFDGLLRVESLEKYSERENVWVEKRHMREGVSSAAVCACSEMIYVIGGGPSVKVSTEKVQVYDPSLDSWRVSTPLPEPAKCINAVSLRGIIYVVGGTLRNVLSFNTANEMWSTIGDPLLTERASCGVTLCNDRIFIVGGRDENGKALSNVSYLDPETKLIRSECNMSIGISHHGCITLQKYDQVLSKSV
ncbi:kelch-like protein 6 [Clavelina lepadiformis]|uniref:kelch-like protein 6 n=1 Tax=Clavelina lepadiformis TaxID=159417 RepID=UPI004043315D